MRRKYVVYSLIVFLFAIILLGFSINEVHLKKVLKNNLEESIDYAT